MNDERPVADEAHDNKAHDKRPRTFVAGLSPCVCESAGFYCPPGGMKVPPLPAFSLLPP